MSNLADHSSSTNRWPRSFFFFSKESVRRTAPFATDSGDGDFDASVNDPGRSPFAEFDARARASAEFGRPGDGDDPKEEGPAASVVSSTGRETPGTAADAEAWLSLTPAPMPRSAAAAAAASAIVGRPSSSEDDAELELERRPWPGVVLAAAAAASAIVGPPPSSSELEAEQRLLRR